MNKLLITLLLLPSLAFAEQWLEAANDAGGKILLLQTKCGSGKNDGRMVIATTSKGDSVNGCWYYFAEMVHVVWKDGKTSSFNSENFMARESK